MYKYFSKRSFKMCFNNKNVNIMFGRDYTTGSSPMFGETASLSNNRYKIRGSDLDRWASHNGI